MKTYLNTLYITTQPSYVRLNNQTLQVEVERQTRLRIPLHHIGGLVCFGSVLVSTGALCALAAANKYTVFLSEFGRFQARVTGPVSGNILLRKAQFAAAASNSLSLELARTLTAGKIQNCRNLLLRSARDTQNPDDQQALQQTAQQLANSLKKLEKCPNLEVLRGIEGQAAKRYFGALPHALIPNQRQDFRPTGRTKRPPRDRFNALISFLYGMLRNDCQSALETAGLDPQLGFLHTLRPGRPALALDLMEAYRPLLADRLALTLINRGQIKTNDFRNLPGGAVHLDESGRRTVIEAYQNRKNEQLQHPLLKEPIPLGLSLFVQARLLARTLRNDLDHYPPFTPR